MPKLSVIIPVYNEAPNLDAFFRTFYAVPCPIEQEVIVVDDGSTDGSADRLKALQPTYGFRLIAQLKNQGKGSSLRRGFQEATGDYLIIQDADFEYDAKEIPSLLVPLLEGRADVVYGSRFRKDSHQVHRTYHYFVNRFLTFCSNLLSGIYLTDMETCYKVFRRDLLQSMRLVSVRFGIEVELTAYVAKTQARIMELPISYYPRTRLQGKKINWKDGVAALWHLVYFNLIRSETTAFERLPAQYLSKNHSTVHTA